MSKAKTQQLRDALVTNIENTSDWRARKAAEFPDDKRNEAAAGGLYHLASHVRQLPDDARIFRAYAAAGERSLSISEIESEALSRFGFDEPAEPEAFLASLAGQIEQKIGSSSSAGYTGD